MREKTTEEKKTTRNSINIILIKKNENTLQLWDRVFRRNSYLQAVCDAPIARITGYVSSLFYNIHITTCFRIKYSRIISQTSTYFMNTGR